MRWIGIARRAARECAGAPVASIVERAAFLWNERMPAAVGGLGPVAGVGIGELDQILVPEFEFDLFAAVVEVAFVFAEDRAGRCGIGGGEGGCILDRDGVFAGGENALAKLDAHRAVERIAAKGDGVRCDVADFDEVELVAGRVVHELGDGQRNLRQPEDGLGQGAPFAIGLAAAGANDGGFANDDGGGIDASGGSAADGARVGGVGGIVDGSFVGGEGDRCPGIHEATAAAQAGRKDGGDESVRAEILDHLLAAVGKHEEGAGGGDGVGPGIAV